MATDSTTASRTSSTQFVVLSDTHNIELGTLPDDNPLRSATPKADVVLHCGDLTQVGGISAYKKALELLGSFDAELKLVIAGNHDISLDGEYWRTHLAEDDGPEEHQQAVDIMTGALAKDAGVTYLTEGTHTFCLRSGATFTIYATPYQPECGNWAFSYKRTEDRFSTANHAAKGTTSIATISSAVPDHVDIMMTHGPSREFLDLIPSENEHAGCDALLNAVRRARPLLHCFGHIHEGYGVRKVEWDGQIHGDEHLDIRQASVAQAGSPDGRRHSNVAKGVNTLMVNAAIMDNDNQPVHAPWVIDLELIMAA